MKKQYVAPQMVVYKIEARKLLDGSPGVRSSSPYNIKYGGVDRYGELEPE